MHVVALACRAPAYGSETDDVGLCMVRVMKLRELQDETSRYSRELKRMADERHKITEKWGLPADPEYARVQDLVLKLDNFLRLG